MDAAVCGQSGQISPTAAFPYLAGGFMFHPNDDSEYRVACRLLTDVQRLLALKLGQLEAPESLLGTDYSHADWQAHRQEIAGYFRGYREGLEVAIALVSAWTAIMAAKL